MRRATAPSGGEGLVLTLAGSETFLLYEMKFPLREFAAFEVALDEQALEELERRFVTPIMERAAAAGAAVVLDAPTWRASPDYLDKLGYTAEGDLERIVRACVAAQQRVSAKWRPRGLEVVISAEIGPRGDGYVAASAMTPDEARAYHQPTIAAAKAAGVDMVTAYTMTNLNEAAGVALAAAQIGVPAVISCTIETDGRLPDGHSLGELVTTVDAMLASRGAAQPLAYMVNCAHPTHLAPALAAARAAGAAWLPRLRGLRANGSCLSHAELDALTELDAGDIPRLGADMAALHRSANLRVLGGCCGTDARHIASILDALGRGPA